MYSTALLEQPAQAARSNQHNASIEKILQKHLEKNHLGGWATMSAIMDETRLERQEVISILRALMAQGRLENILGNSPGNHRYRLKVADSSSVVQEPINNTVIVPATSRIVHPAGVTSKALAPPLPGSRPNRETLPKTKALPKRANKISGKTVSPAKNTLKSVNLQRDGSILINLERRPGGTTVLMSLEDAVAIGQAAVKKLLQEKISR